MVACVRALVCVFLFLVVAFLDAERSFLFFVAPAFSPPPARPRFQEIHEQETNSLPLRLVVFFWGGMYSSSTCFPPPRRRRANYSGAYRRGRRGVEGVRDRGERKEINNASAFVEIRSVRRVCIIR